MDVSITRTSGTLEDALGDLNKSLTKAQRDVGKTIAGVGRRVILEQALRKRGTLSMSGMNVKKLGAAAKIKPTPTSVTVTLTAKPAGPWAIVERGTKEHEIAPTKGRVGRNGRPAALELFGMGSGFYAASTLHDGARGFYVWAAATAGGGDSEIERAVTATFDEAVDEAMV